MMKIILDIIDGPYSGKTFQFTEFPVSIGRMPSNNLNLPYDQYVSRAHFSFIQDQSNIMIIDLSSTNGTYVNNKRIESPIIIRNNDVITIGNTNIRCQIE